MFRWCVINPEYLNYMKKVESRIPNFEYSDKKNSNKKMLKPFFGIVFEHNDFVYVAQVNHPQSRHNFLKEDFDFKKIIDPRTNQLKCVVNLNYMFPVPKEEITYIDYSNISTFRDFSSTQEKLSYMSLLNLEMKLINKKNISDSAKTLFNLKKTKPNTKISERCFDFINLENECANWTRLKLLSKSENNENIINYEFYNENDNKLYRIIQNSKKDKYFFACPLNKNNEEDRMETALFSLQDGKIVHKYNVREHNVETVKMNNTALWNKIIEFGKNPSSKDKIINNVLLNTSSDNFKVFKYKIMDIEYTNNQYNITLSFNSKLFKVKNIALDDGHIVKVVSNSQHNIKTSDNVME